MYTVASPDPDPNPREGGQLPNPNECNSTLTSGTRGVYPHRYILMLMSGVTAYVSSTRGVVMRKVPNNRLNRLWTTTATTVPIENSNE